MQPYKRRIFLINKTFQLRFSFYVCSWIFALSLAYPLIVTSLFDQLIRYAALDPQGPALEQLRAGRKEVLLLLVLLQASFVGITFLISLFTSHRIAGPLYKLDKFMRETAEGNIHAQIQFRKNDHFQNLAESYSLMMKSLLARGDRKPAHEQALQRLEQIGTGLHGSSKEEIAQIVKTLRSP